MQAAGGAWYLRAAVLLLRPLRGCVRKMKAPKTWGKKGPSGVKSAGIFHVAPRHDREANFGVSLRINVCAFVALPDRDL